MELYKKLWVVKENLQNTCAVMFVLGMFFLGPFAGLTLSLLLMFTPFFPLILIYSIWIYLDRKTPEVGGRRIDWLRSAKIKDRFLAYFPIKFVKTADLPPTKNYIFAVFPHGILGVGAHALGGTNSEFQKLFPGITPVGHTLNVNFYVPFSREYLINSGVRSISKEAISNVIKDGQGKASVLVVGGSAEAMYSNPGVHTIILKDRKGFVKLALIHGVDLVPVYVFGEVELYHTYMFPNDSIVHKTQQFIRSITGWAFVLFWGRGIFQNFFGFLPYKKPLHVVFGKPITVEKNENPSKEDVTALHKKFILDLNNLFNTNKYNYLSNPESTVLTMI